MGAIDLDVLEKEVANDKGSRPDKQRLTIRQPNDILALEFSDADLLLKNGYLAKGDPATILGAGGIGKSRLVMQLAICCILNRRFLGQWETQGEGVRWLFLQTENSNRRLKDDLLRYRQWVGRDWSKVQDHLFIHCLENEIDGFTYLNNLHNCVRIHAAIADVAPGVVVWDALKDFQTGNLNDDEQMQLTLSEISRLTRIGERQRIPLVVHHAGTGRAGAAKAVGFERNSFGRNSKVLHSWTRAQINVVACQPDSNEQLIISSGKLNNFSEFKPFGIRLNPDTMIYEADSTVDVEGWADEVGGNKRRVVTLADLECVFESGKRHLARSKALEVLGRVTGLKETACYSALSPKGKYHEQLRERDGLLEFVP